jgi:hypothetical protein
VTGEVRVADFRDGDGVVDPGSQSSHTWIPFVLAVPSEPAGASGAPVATHGHGLLANKETMLVVASHDAARGVATMGTDVPDHGGRQADQGGHLLDLTSTRDLGRIARMVPQGIVDIISHSLLRPVFSPIIPARAGAGDAAALLGAASMLDLGDATHQLDGLAASARPVLAQVGVGDAPHLRRADRHPDAVGLAGRPPPRIGPRSAGLTGRPPR